MGETGAEKGINNMSNQDKVVKWLWYGGVFFFMFVWFSQVHPLAVYSADDWGHISYARSAVPELSKWNPAKLLPELLMSLTSTVAAFTIYPIINDYILSITVMSAFTVSAFITVYLYCLGIFLRRTLNLPVIKNMFAQALFFIMHFLIFRAGDSGNSYLFQCADLTCYYNYLIPGLLNASLVLCIFGNERFKSFLREGDDIKRGLLLLVVYFAVFSNLVDSMIFVGYIALELFVGFLESIKRKDIKTFGRNSFFYIGVMGLWIISAVFELSGGRAALAAEERATLMESLGRSMEFFMGVIQKMHKVFLLLLVVLILGGMLIVLAERKKFRIIGRQMGLLLAMTGGMLLFTVVIGAAVNPSYISRSEYVFGLFFYVLLLETLCFGIILKKFDHGVLFVPLFLCITASFINTNGNTFGISGQPEVSDKIFMEISKDLVEQVAEADKEGKTSVDVQVTDSGKENNWPQAVYMGEYLSAALYKHGVIKHKIEVTIVPSMEYNEKYQVY